MRAFFARGNQRTFRDGNYRTPRGHVGRVPIARDLIHASTVAFAKDVVLNETGTGPWFEVGPWDSCRLMVKKHGRGVTFAVEHNGAFDCCKEEAFIQSGTPRYGIGQSSMPRWMVCSLIANLENFRDEYPESIEDEPRNIRGDIRVISWTLDTIDWGVVVVESRSTGARYEVPINRERFLEPNGLRSSRVDPEGQVGILMDLIDGAPRVMTLQEALAAQIGA